MDRAPYRFHSSTWPFLLSAVNGKVVQNVYEPVAKPLPAPPVAKRVLPPPQRRTV